MFLLRSAPRSAPNNSSRHMQPASTQMQGPTQDRLTHHTTQGYVHRPSPVRAVNYFFSVARNADRRVDTAPPYTIRLYTTGDATPRSFTASSCTYQTQWRFLRPYVDSPIGNRSPPTVASWRIRTGKYALHRFNGAAHAFTS
jgi:hypothetical protein